MFAKEKCEEVAKEEGGVFLFEGFFSEEFAFAVQGGGNGGQGAGADEEEEGCVGR